MGQCTSFLLFLRGKKVAIFHMQAPHPIHGYRNMHEKIKNNNVTLGNMLNWFNEKISMMLLKNKSVSMFVLPSTEQIVKNYGFSDKEIFLTNNGVEVEYIKKIPEGEKQYDACWVGRPHPQKGLDDLIDIWSIVTETKPSAQLVLMGAKTEQYQQYISTKNLDKNILIKGYVSDEEKYEIMKRSRLFLSTSYFESFHIAVMEAAACGLTVIAYDLPVYNQIYGSILSYVRIGDKKRYAEKIIYYVDTDEERKKTKENMVDFIADFDWDSIAEHVYKQLKNV